MRERFSGGVVVEKRSHRKRMVVFFVLHIQLLLHGRVRHERDCLEGKGDLMQRGTENLFRCCIGK